MWHAIKEFLLSALKVLGFVLLGIEREKRKQAEAERDVERKHGKIDRRPDVDRPFSRMRDKGR